MAIDLILIKKLPRNWLTLFTKIVKWEKVNIFLKKSTKINLQLLTLTPGKTLPYKSTFVFVIIICISIIKLVGIPKKKFKVINCQTIRYYIMIFMTISASVMLAPDFKRYFFCNELVSV